MNHKTIENMFVIISVLWIVGLIGLGYTAIHFITKFW